MKNKLIFSFLLIIFLTPVVHGQKLSSLVARNEKAIFQIFAYDEYGSPSAIGTGFYTNNRGKGLTNLHVIEEARFAFIRDHEGRMYQIKEIIRVCEACDMAEILIDTKGQANYFLNTTKDIPPKGSDIFVIGNPEGLESTVSTGIISSIREQENKVIQISAPISPGSSGSPIMNMAGNVIGIATFQYIDGQNLNFGYWIGCMDKLAYDRNYSLSNNQTQDLFVLNEVCKGEPNLIINSIELTEKNTVVNLSFTNTSLAYGDDAYIFTKIGDKSESYYIQDNYSGEKFYAYNSTIGNSPQDPTFVKLGETVRFKLYFPSIKQANFISIKEGMSGSDWSFNNIYLSNYRELSFENKNFFNDFYLQTALAYLSKQDFVNAYIVLKEYTNTNKDNAYGHNLAGIVSFIMDNNLDAFVHMQQAIRIAPTDDNLYFNLYYLQLASGNLNEALKSISTAIILNDQQPEYYVCRAEIYYENESWANAEADYSKFINSDRSISYDIYFKRGVARLWLNNSDACKDFEISYGICTDEEEKEAIAEIYNSYCR